MNGPPIIARNASASASGAPGPPKNTQPTKARKPNNAGVPASTQAAVFCAGDHRGEPDTRSIPASGATTGNTTAPPVSSATAVYSIALGVPGPGGATGAR